MLKRVYSAMRPTGELHIGHYFGALENWVKMQDEYDCFFSVADWHALTTNFDNPENIKELRRRMIINWMAVGLNPEKCTIFVQSHNLYTAELYLLLGMITPVSWLERCPTYKEMIQALSSKDISNYGFLGYPVLMTADIIMYNANYVPVGVDQIPHVELAREIGRRFNHLYGKIFIDPEAMLTKVPKLLGLDGRKMSKSYGNSILLSDDFSVTDKKIKTMVTDVKRQRKTDPGDPDVCPVFDYHKVFSTESERNEITKGCRSAAIGCIDCKKILIKHMEEFLTPIHAKLDKYDKEIKDIDEFLAPHQAKANKEAGEMMEKVRKAIKI